MVMVVVVKLNMMMTTVKIFPSGKDQTARSSDGPSDVPDLSVCHTSRHSHGHRHPFLLVAIVICLPIFVWHPLATLDTSFWGEVRTWHLILILASPMSSLSAGCHITIGTIIASFSWHRQLHVEVQQLNKGLFRAPSPHHCNLYIVTPLMLYKSWSLWLLLQLSSLSIIWWDNPYFHCILQEITVMNSSALYFCTASIELYCIFLLSIVKWGPHVCRLDETFTMWCRTMLRASSALQCSNCQCLVPWGNN